MSAAREGAKNRRDMSCKVELVLLVLQLSIKSSQFFSRNDHNPKVKMRRVQRQLQHETRPLLTPFAWRVAETCLLCGFEGNPKGTPPYICICVYIYMYIYIYICRLGGVQLPFKKTSHPYLLPHAQFSQVWAQNVTLTFDKSLALFEVGHLFRSGKDGDTCSSH